MSARARKVGTQGGPVGHLVWFSVPSLTADYDELKDLADLVGLNESYTPNPPTAREAWRKHTNTGKRGVQIDPIHLNSMMMQEARENGHGQPRAFLRSVEISRSAPLLVRHLVLFVVLPGAKGKEEQLEVGTVAVLEFDTESAQVRAVVDAWDQNWVLGSHIDGVVQGMMDAMKNYAYLADNNKVRASIRDLLEDFHRTCLKSTGGVYFVPLSAVHVHEDGGITTAQNGLAAMKSWVDGMDQWARNRDDTPMFRRVILDGENAQELRDDIVRSAIAQFQDELQGIADSLGPVFDNRAVGRTAERMTENAVAALGKIMDGARTYRDSLDLKLDELAAMFRMAQQAVLKAQRQMADDEDQDVDADDIMALLAD